MRDRRTNRHLSVERRFSKVPDPTRYQPFPRPIAPRSAPDVPSVVSIPSRLATTDPWAEQRRWYGIGLRPPPPNVLPALLRRPLRKSPNAGLPFRFAWNSPASRPTPFRAAPG